MRVSRRQFLTLGAGAVAAASAGCDQTPLRRWIGKPTHPPLAGLLTAPGSAEIDAASHILNRLTFGARPGDHARVTAMGVSAFIDEQLAPERLNDSVCERVIRHECDTLADPESHLFRRKGDDKDPLQQLFPALRDHGARVGELYEYKEKVLLDELTRGNIFRAVYSQRQLFEVMVNFWSDHFNIDPSKGECKWLKTADDRDVIRAHALGNFREMLRASAVSPAMLWYLDGRVNRRKDAAEKPNENYARELLELHTLGVHGGYTQQDVMEVARCLTGWTARDKKRFFRGRVEFDKQLHDDASKRVLGIDIPAGLGAGDLDRVLEIVALHPSTARHIATKLGKYFISDQTPERAIVATADAFQNSGGDIRTTLRALFATSQFSEARGLKVKRPFHFVVSALRATNAETDVSKGIVDYLVRMGHAPFRYPTPDGYPLEGSHWTSTLLWRWNFAVALSENTIKGTRVELKALREKLGGDGALIATLLGRAPTEVEARSYQDSGAGLALLLSSPAFQRC
jgi:uncharacterized protein (DUF1800 family)